MNCCIGERRGAICLDDLRPCPSGAALICEEHIRVHPEVPTECETCRESMVSQIEQLVSEGVAPAKARKIVQNASRRA